MTKKLVLLLLLVVIFLRPVQLVVGEHQLFFGRGYQSQYDSLKKLYYNSQYVKKKSPSIIPDETLESFAAGAFLKGINPILIIHDQPPLGRYLLAFSILLFDNPNTIMIVLLVMSIIGVYLIAKMTIKDTIVSLIPVAIFVNEPLFIHKLVYTPLLEPVQLPFILFTIYFFIKAIDEKKDLLWFFLAWIMMGFVIATRFFILGFVLIMSLCVFLVIKKQWKKTEHFFIFSPVAFLVLLFSYTKTIQSGSSLIHIFGIQKYMFYYHKTQLSLPLSFWDLLLFNRWHTWWGAQTIIHDSEWVIVWPIAIVIILIFLLMIIGRKVSYTKYDLVIFLWIAFYSLLLSVGNTSTRYFLPLNPFLYILATSALLHLIQRKKQR